MNMLIRSSLGESTSALFTAALRETRGTHAILRVPPRTYVGKKKIGILDRDRIALSPSPPSLSLFLSLSLSLSRSPSMRRRQKGGRITATRQHSAACPPPANLPPFRRPARAACGLSAFPSSRRQEPATLTTAKWAWRT